MISWPELGTRVTVRYRRPHGSVPPLTDVIGHLLDTTPLVRVRTKTGAVVQFAPGNVVALRTLSDVPVRASEIRALEHAAAMAWPGTEHQWLDGWFLRAGGGFTSRANSAVPLDFSAQLGAVPAIVDWYAQRGLPAWLALPERLLPVRGNGVKPTQVLVRDAACAGGAGTALLGERPDVRWLAIFEREVPLDVLTAVVDGDVVFASVAGAAVGRGAVTSGPDGTTWLGISAVRVVPDRRGQGHARAVCSALLHWGAQHGAQRCYVQVLDDNSSAIALYASMGFRRHHSHRYMAAGTLLAPTV